MGGHAAPVPSGRIASLLARSVAGLPDPYVLVGPSWGADGRELAGLEVLFANPLAESQWGQPAGGLIGADLLALLPGQPPDGLAGSFAAVLRGGGCLVVNEAGLALVGPNGRLPVYDLLAWQVEELLAVTWRDATAERDSLDRLASVAARRSLLAALGEAVIVYDRSGRILVANEAAERIAGFTLKGVDKDRDGMVRLSPVDGDGQPLTPAQTPGAIALRTGRPVRDFVVGFRRPDIGTQWVLANCEPILGPDGSAEAVVSSMTDITSFRAAQEALRASDRRFSEVLDAIGDPLLVLRAHPEFPFQLQHCNGAGSRLLATAGVDPADADGLGSAPGHPGVAALLALAQEVAGAGVTPEVAQAVINWPATQGPPARYDVRLVPISSDEGALLAVVARDVTEDRRLREQLERSHAQAHADRAGLRAIVDSIQDPLVVLQVVRDGSGAVVDLVVKERNLSAREYMTVVGDHLEGAATSSFLPPPVARYAYDLVERVAPGRPLRLDDSPGPPGLFPDDRWFDLRAVALGADVSVSWRDVTDRHRAAVTLAESESLFRAISTSSADIICHATPDQVLRYVSPAVVDVLGWQPEELVGRNAAEIWHPDDRPLAGQMVRDALVTGVGTLRGRLLRTDGDWRWAEVRLARMAGTAVDAAASGPADPPAIGGFVAVIRDVHEQRITEQALLESQERLRGTIDTLLDPWVLLEAVRDASGVIVDFRFIDANQAACRANQLAYDQLMGRTLLELLPAHGPTGLFARYAEVVETGEPLAMDDLPYVGLDGVERRSDNRAARVGDGVSFTWRDVTERYRARQELARLALRDPLTGLVNREELRRRTQAMFAGSPRSSQKLAVLFCDLDRFKEINDTYGHAAGDTVLREVGTRILGVLRAEDVVARVGGDEFVVVLARVHDSKAALQVAEKIHEAIGMPVAIDEVFVQPRMSTGVSVALRGSDPELVMRAADAALYRAKMAGRNRIELLD